MYLKDLVCRVEDNTVHAKRENYTTSLMTNENSRVILTLETKNNYFYRKENDHEDYRLCYVLYERI